MDNTMDNSWFGIFGIIALLALGGGGLFGGNRGYGVGANDYSNELQTSILENSANQRQTCADFANTNSNIVNGNYQTQNAVNGGFTQIYRDLGTASQGIVTAIRNNEQTTQGLINGLGKELSECCCGLQRQIDGVNYNTTTQVQQIKDMIAQNKIENLQSQLSALQLQNAMAGVVRYPSAITYNGGTSPFCGCGCNC